MIIMDFERPHGEILLASELAERAATYANRTVRVVGWCEPSRKERGSSVMKPAASVSVVILCLSSYMLFSFPSAPSIAEFDPATDQLTLSHGEGKVSVCGGTALLSLATYLGLC